MTFAIQPLVTRNVTLDKEFILCRIFKQFYLAPTEFFCQIAKVEFFSPGLHDSVIVGNNKNHLTSLSNWLTSITKSVNSLWKRCWRASVDGWAASTFHSLCDSKGPTVTIIRVGRYIFGGYTSISWGK